MWFMSLLVDDVPVLNGQGLSCGTILMEQNNYPFAFTVNDNANLGIDPFRLEDFADGRCTMYMFERLEIAELRGFDVK